MSGYAFCVQTATARPPQASGSAGERPAAFGERPAAAWGQPAGGGLQRGQRWWRAWRERFGLAEVCGTAAAVAGFAAGYLPSGSLAAAGWLATAGEAAGFYGCLSAKAALAAWRATAHLAGLRRLARAAWHAVREQLASCAAAEVLDFTLIRPGCIAGAAWLLRPLPGGVWLGLLAGKAVADVIWYGTEAVARRAVARPGIS